MNGIQWTGDNMAEVLVYTGFHDVLINSLGNPVVYYPADRTSIAVEPGNWVFRWNDELHVVSDRAWTAVAALLELAARRP